MKAYTTSDVEKLYQAWIAEFFPGGDTENLRKAFESANYSGMAVLIHESEVLNQRNAQFQRN